LGLWYVLPVRTGMQIRILLAALMIALVALGPARAATFTVSIAKTGFTPSALTIAVGDTATWRNDDSTSHQIASKSAGFTSPLIKPGETFSFTYKEAGRFSYQDETVRKNKGTVTVQGAPTTISLTASASTTLVVYGGTVTLSGATSSKRAGEAVTIYAQPYGTTTSGVVGSALTEGAGSWSFVVRPKVLTTYQARWKPATVTATSSSIAVRVRPQVLFRVKAVSGRTVTFFTKARAARSLAGRTLSLQRRNAFGQWVILRKVTLTSTSAATFKSRLPKGRSRVRMFLPKPQAGPGYMAGISRTRILAR
jgi:plastocyanin